MNTSSGVPLAASGDTVLVGAWFGGRDQQALEQLLVRHTPALQRYVRARQVPELRPKADAVDIVQDAVVQLLAYQPPFPVSTSAQFRGLLRVIVDRLLLAQQRFFRRQRRNVAREQDALREAGGRVHEPLARDPSPSSIVRAEEATAELRHVLAGLDPLDGRIVTLRTEQQLDFEAIGCLVGMRADSARVRFRRALAKLASRLDPPSSGVVRAAVAQPRTGGR